MLNTVINYFDLQEHYRPGAVAHVAGAKLLVLPQYLFLVLGIIVQPYLANYQTNGTFDFDLAKFWPWVVFSAFIGLMLFPSAYKKLKKSSHINFLDLCAIFSSGVTWQTLFSSGQRAALGL